MKTLRFRSFFVRLAPFSARFVAWLRSVRALEAFVTQMIVKTLAGGARGTEIAFIFCHLVHTFLNFSSGGAAKRD